MTSEIPASFLEGVTALIAVDLQPDFMPGGPLAVDGGDTLVEPVNRLLHSGLFRLAVATQDWHPRGHVSFASSHPGRKPFDVIELHGRPQTLWPDHCVQATPGAALHAALRTERFAAIVRKGTSPGVDSYSAFRNNHGPGGARPPTGLAGFLREQGVTHVVLAGLARDFCVLWSAEDAADAGFETAVLWNVTRPVDPASDGRVRAALATRGVAIVEAATLPH